MAIKLYAKIASAVEASLLEDQGAPLVVEDNAIRLDLHPYEIKTVILQLVAGQA